MNFFWNKLLNKAIAVSAEDPMPVKVIGGGGGEGPGGSDEVTIKGPLDNEGRIPVTLPGVQPISGTVSLATAQYNTLARRDDIAKLASAVTAAVVTPNDTTDLAAGATKGIMVGTSGDIVVDMVTSGASITLKNIAAGIIHPLSVKRIRATGTTATDIVAVY
ncbi:hypothetical protein EBB07_33835 [Paenibacillaceae bacterium]|nr:hypothetical protein EBB07_33835 [Paenibacillaceae bacterium]